jgi:hypothetical protein
MIMMAPPNKKQKSPRPWQQVAKEAQDYRDASLARVKPGLQDLFDTSEKALRSIHLNSLTKTAIPTLGEVLHPEDVKITETLPEILIAALASGEVSATDVATAFLRRAVIAQKLVSVECYLF